MAAYAAVGRAVSGVKTINPASDNCSQIRNRHGISVVGRDRPGSYLLSGSRGTNREAVSSLFGLPQRVAGASGTSPALATRSLWERKCRGTPRFGMMIVSQCFWAESVRVLCDAVVVYLAVDGGS